jgi:3-hydroxyisobutyrate dehydrogenase-like beta-hydroxyacid dehydrogenase
MMPMDNINSTAVLGLGTMGRAVADRLASRGLGVAAWSRSGPPQAWQPHDGVTVADSISAAVSAADVVLLVLADDTAVTAVTTQIAPSLQPSAVVVSLSTIHPETAKHLPSLLPQGTDFVDAPVMGSCDAVAVGELGIMVGAATPTAAERALPVLREIGHPRVVGEVGTASALKVTLMSAVIPTILAIGEALKTGRSLGLAEDTVVEGLLASPLVALTKRTMSVTAHYPVRLAAKDLAIGAAAGDRAVADAARAALVDGTGDLDLGAFARATGE